MNQNTENQSLIKFVLDKSKDKTLQKIGEKVLNLQRISEEDALYLFNTNDLAMLGALANFVRESKNGNFAFFNRNIHIEPSNICIYKCQFCSFKRKKGEEGAWDFSMQEVLDKVASYKGQGITEIHIVGGVHPDYDIHYYGEMLRKIHTLLPGIHIKGFTAVEIDYMARKGKLTLQQTFEFLKEAGLNSMPGGGAEIFDLEVRRKICKDKADTDRWLEIHEAAHNSGMKSNSTILYGHVENYGHRVEHMKILRDLQDKTGGFNAFIPLKFRKENNELSYLEEVSVTEDLKNYAVSRIFLDNIPHIKAYWLMIGKQTTQLSLAFGVDDVDGTIDDTTKIYSMAGAEDKVPTMTTEQLIQIIRQAGRTPVERDTLYNAIKIYE